MPSLLFLKTLSPKLREGGISHNYYLEVQAAKPDQTFNHKTRTRAHINVLRFLHTMCPSCKNASTKIVYFIHPGVICPSTSEHRWEQSLYQFEIIVLIQNLNTPCYRYQFVCVVWIECNISSRKPNHQPWLSQLLSTNHRKNGSVFNIKFFETHIISHGAAKWKFR